MMTSVPSAPLPPAGRLRALLRWLGLGLLGAIVLPLAACRSQLIPNTDVEDTRENRDIIQFCERYRKAVEHRDVHQLVELAHENYYEDGGNIDAEDDLDKAGLEGYLRTKFSDAKAIRYEIRYRRIGKGRNDVLFVDYTYSASYQLPTEEGDVWRRTVADNRLELVPRRDGFLILSGM
jgi:hypothetical protein